MFRLLVPLLFLLVGCEQAASDLLLGRVVGIADGDTFTMLLAESRTVRIRLDQVDAPERAQAWSRQSQEMLARLLRAGPVRVRVEDTDRYGRSVGRVYAGAVDVNLTMVEQGGAWAYPQYVRDRAFVRAEAEGETREARPVEHARKGDGRPLGIPANAVGAGKAGSDSGDATGRGRRGLCLRSQGPVQPDELLRRGEPVSADLRARAPRPRW